MPSWQNLIAGREERSRSAGRLEVRAGRAPFEVLGDFPRSGLPEVERALALLEPGTPPRELRALVEGWRAPEELLRRVAATLGFEEDEPFSLAPTGAARPPGLAGARRAPAAPAEGVALVAPGWSRLAEGVLRPVLGQLLRGRAVLLVADERLPWIAQDLGEALLEGGLPEERLAVLHGLTGAGWDAALGDPRVTAIEASGERARLRRFRSPAADRPGREVHLDVDRTGARALPPEDPPERWVEEVLRAAFGRRTTLSGQTSGQLARVYCPEAYFSRFTECLLAHLEASPAGRRPLPQVDAAAVARARTTWTQGLDEGATLISGGEAPGEGARERRLYPTVFTNVEPRGGLALRPDPAPVLALIRDRA